MTSPLIPGTPGFVERLLAERIGLDVASVGEGLIRRGVEARMKQLGVRRVDDYQRILLEPSDEIQALIEEVVIPESWFFRDDRPFATFRRFVSDGWVDQPRRRPISVLCLPCASGEEPYSVAITLLELGLTRERFEVIAVDISLQSIRRATAGIYGANAFRGMDPRVQAEYFTPVPGRHQLKAAIRAAVRFEPGNILDPTLLDRHDPFDVVFCRNLLIYFDGQARVKAFANLDRLVAAGGLLFLGHADRADQDAATRFATYADSGSFVFRKQSSQQGPAAPAAAVDRTRAPAPARPRPDPPRPVAQPSPGDASPPTRPAEPRAGAPAAPVAPSRVDVMKEASTLAGQGRYAEATRLIRQQVGQASLDASVHFLLGIIQQAAGNYGEAEAELSKAIYLDPEHDEALLAMALIARRKGDVAAESFYRRRSERVLARKGRS